MLELFQLIPTARAFLAGEVLAYFNCEELLLFFFFCCRIIYGVLCCIVRFMQMINK